MYEIIFGTKVTYCVPTEVWKILLQWFAETTTIPAAWNIEIITVILKVMNFLLITLMDWGEGIFFVF